MVEIISDVQREKNRALDAFTQEKNFLKGQITRKEADESSDEKPTFESLEKIKKQKVSLKLTTNEEFNGKLVDVIKWSTSNEDLVCIENGEWVEKFILIKDITTASLSETPKADYAMLQIDQWAKIGTNTKLTSATRISAYGSFWKKLNTSAFAFMNLDGNPLKTKWFGKLSLSQQVYKWLNLEGVYTFATWTNIVHFWVSYTQKMADWSVKLTLLPLSTEWKAFTVGLSFNQSLWKEWKWWKLSSFVQVDFLDKQAYWETEWSKTLGQPGKQNLASHLAAFVQTRYGGAKTEEWKSKGFVQGVTGLRLKIN